MTRRELFAAVAGMFLIPRYVKPVPRPGTWAAVERSEYAFWRNSPYAGYPFRILGVGDYRYYHLGVK